MYSGRSWAAGVPACGGREICFEITWDERAIHVHEDQGNAVVVWKISTNDPRQPTQDGSRLGCGVLPDVDGGTPYKRSCSATSICHHTRNSSASRVCRIRRIAVSHLASVQSGG